ncbi:MAG: phenylalanine--tRNA ligase beta subunit-related protein [Anaerolineales bacterium]
MFQVSEGWKKAYPNAHAGVLVMRGVINPPHHAELEKQKTALEEQIRARFAGQERPQIAAHPVLEAYEAYYKRFKKTYHVQLQLESILLKGKSIPGVAALVEAMFMAEMDDLLLTAGHDLDSLQLPVTLNASQGGETYVTLRGFEQTLKTGDMFIADSTGILSSIIYGPDERTQISPQTRNALFTVYAPEGIGPALVETHLRNIEQNVLVIAPRAQTELLSVFGAR